MDANLIAACKARVDAIDLTAVRNDLVTRAGLTAAAADQSVDLYRKFLTLKATYPRTVIAIPYAGDDAWHWHMLRSSQYRTDCLAAVGHVVDHNPDAFGTPQFAAVWAETCRLWNEHFGEELVTDPTARDASALAPTGCYDEIPDMPQVKAA